MLPKQQHRDEGEGSGNQNKRRQILSSSYKVVRNVRSMQEFLPGLEPIIRKWVRDEVVHAFDRVKRSSSSGFGHPSSGIGCSGSRPLQLQFSSNLLSTLYTGSKVVSEDGSPIRLILRDSISNDVVRCGPFSSAKVNIVALDGDFDPDDQEGWLKEDFNSNIVQSREGKRPLLTGDLAVYLQNGEGQIGHVIFTDNSSWMRSRKFRLGAKVLITDDISIREAVSNRFQIKDHRGESYEKHHPPLLDDEVWRLENIGKDGVFHRRLTDAGIFSVQDFLRRYEMSPPKLRSVLLNIPNNTWDKIIRHAKRCRLDDKRYTYMDAMGTELFFNSIYKVVGVRFARQGYQSVDTLNMHQRSSVEVLKQDAYRNINDLILVSNTPYINYAMPPVYPTDNFGHPTSDLLEKDFHVEQGQPEIQMNNYQPTISLPCGDGEVHKPHGDFEIGGSSQMQGFNPAYTNSFGMSAFSPGMFCIHTWTPGTVYSGSPLSAEDLPVNDNFRGEPSSAWQGNGLPFCDSSKS